MEQLMQVLRGGSSDELRGGSSDGEGESEQDQMSSLEDTKTPAMIARNALDKMDELRIVFEEAEHVHEAPIQQQRVKEMLFYFNSIETSCRDLLTNGLGRAEMRNFSKWINTLDGFYENWETILNDDEHVIDYFLIVTTTNRLHVVDPLTMRILSKSQCKVSDQPSLHRLSFVKVLPSLSSVVIGSTGDVMTTIFEIVR
jgi:hypothetical protein